MLEYLLEILARPFPFKHGKIDQSLEHIREEFL